MEQQNIDQIKELKREEIMKQLREKYPRATSFSIFFKWDQERMDYDFELRNQQELEAREIKTPLQLQIDDAIKLETENDNPNKLEHILIDFDNKNQKMIFDIPKKLKDDASVKIDIYENEEYKVTIRRPYSWLKIILNKRDRRIILL